MTGRLAGRSLDGFVVSAGPVYGESNRNLAAVNGYEAARSRHDDESASSWACRFCSSLFGGKTMSA